MSRAPPAMGRASGSVCHVQTPPLCSETGSASASAARVSTARPEPAMVKKKNYLPSWSFDDSQPTLAFKILVFFFKFSWRGL